MKDLMYTLVDKGLSKEHPSPKLCEKIKKLFESALYKWYYFNKHRLNLHFVTAVCLYPGGLSLQKMPEIRRKLNV